MTDQNSDQIEHNRKSLESDTAGDLHIEHQGHKIYIKDGDYVDRDKIVYKELSTAEVAALFL